MGGVATVYLEIFTKTDAGVFGLKYVKLNAFYILTYYSRYDMVAISVKE